MTALVSGCIALLLMGFVSVTVWGRRSVPKDRRFPIALGVPPSVEWTVGRATGLIAYLSIGLWLSLLTWFAASSSNLMGWIGIALLVFFLFMEVHTIRRLKR